MYRFFTILAIAFAPAFAQSLATVTVQRAPSGPVVPQDFMGLSIQQSLALQYFGNSPTGDTVLFTLMKNLGRGTIRIGGAAADSDCLSGVTAPTPSICQYMLTSADFKSWAYASSQTGWPMIIGLSLAQNESPGAPQYVLNEVTTGILPITQAYPHASLLGLELGNELNLYYMNPAYRPATYSVNDQITDLLSYITAFKGNASTQTIPLLAPAYFNPSASTITSQLDPLLAGVVSCSTCSPTNIGLVTLHEYALNAGKIAPTITALLSPTLIQNISQSFQKAVNDISSLYKLQVQIDETNSVIPDPGQPDVSNVQASALWALDYSLQMARLGVRRINFHIHDGSFYDPIQVTVPSPGVYQVQIQPEYYGMYAFSAAKGQQFLPLTISTTANVRAYALSSCATCAITIYLINKDLAASGPIQVSLSSPGTSATYLELSAPTLSSYGTAVTYGGVQFDPTTGMLTSPAQATAVQPDPSGNYTVTLDNAAAGILTIQP